MDAAFVWSAALERLRPRTAPNVFEACFTGSVAVNLTSGHLTVTVPTAAAYRQLTNHFHELARVAVSEVLGRSAQLDLILKEATEPEPLSPMLASPETQRMESRPTHSLPPVPSPRSAHVTSLDPRISGPPPRRTGSEARPTPRLAPADDAHHSLHGLDALHPRYTFETFVVGQSNRLAFAAAQELASVSGERYNPLLLFGGVGLGKTHLLHAIGHPARARGLAVGYVTAERFTNDIIEAIRTQTTEAFRLRYRSLDILLVDDIQFIAGKESTEEEFFHTFNALHEANKLIVLSSDRIPRDIRHLHDRLRSRFEWGLMADIQPPDAEQRLAILRAKAAALHYDVPLDVLEVLASRPCQSIRVLEGTLNSVVAHASMLRRPLDVALVDEVLAPFAESQISTALTPPDAPSIIEAVARFYHMSRADLCGKSRERTIAWARHVAMYLLRKDTPNSLPAIGHQLGGRDHTTIMHGYARVERALARSERARDEIATIRAALAT